MANRTYTANNGNVYNCFDRNLTERPDYVAIVMIDSDVEVFALDYYEDMDVGLCAYAMAKQELLRYLNDCWPASNARILSISITLGNEQ